MANIDRDVLAGRDDLHAALLFFLELDAYLDDQAIPEVD